jgi:hypothetical protein
VPEDHRAGVAAVLAADAELDLGLHALRALDGDPHEVADPAGGGATRVRVLAIGVEDNLKGSMSRRDTSPKLGTGIGTDLSGSHRTEKD